MRQALRILGSGLAALAFASSACSNDSGTPAMKDGGGIGGSGGKAGSGGGGGQGGSGGSGGSGGQVDAAVDTLVVDYVVELPVSDAYYNPDMVYTDECNPVMQDCPAGKICNWSCPERAYLCKPEPVAPDGGTLGTHGQECGTAKPCAKGHFCSGVQVAGGMFKILCQKYCVGVAANPNCPPPMSGGGGFCELRGPTCTVMEMFKEPYHLCEI